MCANAILERKALIWKNENNAVCINTENGWLILNATVKEVWELLDGGRTNEEVIKIMIERYQNENGIEEIRDIVNETFDLLLENNIVAIKVQDDFDGWIKYE